MSITYKNVLERLKEERLCHHWSQTQMSQQMRISQSHYSKAELGNRRFTFYEIQYMCESVIDVHYVFTGYRCSYKPNNFMETCSYTELICYMNILFSLAEYFYRNKKIIRWDNIYKRMAYMKYIVVSCKPNNNILYTVRQLEDYTQYEMAELLEVDVKKLRDMENGKTLPDSEILWRIYHLFQIPPAVMIKDKKGLVSEISCFLEMIEINQRDDIFQFLKACHDSV